MASLDSAGENVVMSADGTRMDNIVCPRCNREVWPPLWPWENCDICEKELDEEDVEEEHLAEVEAEKEDAGKEEEEEEKTMADEEKAGGGKAEEGEEDVEAQGMGVDDEWVDALEAALEDKWAVDLEGMLEEEEVVEMVVVEDGKEVEVEVEAAEQLVHPPKRRRWRADVLSVSTASSSLQP